MSCAPALVRPALAIAADCRQDRPALDHAFEDLAGAERLQDQLAGAGLAEAGTQDITAIVESVNLASHGTEGPRDRFGRNP